MNSEFGQSKPSADEGPYKYPVDSCTHLISTSLRDLRLEYQNLSPNQVDSTDLNNKDLAKIIQGT